MQNRKTKENLKHIRHKIHQKVWSLSFFLKKIALKICGKNYENHFRSNIYEVCTAVAHCFPNILDVMVLENIKKNIFR
jgi:hypothetical protein